MKLPLRLLPRLALALFVLPNLRVGAQGKAVNTVVWLSMDGFASAYLDYGQTPFLLKLRDESVYSGKVAPIFPSITFPSHVSIATGVLPEKHGIIGNSFHDSVAKVVYHFPGDAKLLEAEPIWITAQRQGVRSAVYDWPLSHRQSGPVRASYFGEFFQANMPDSERLARVLDAWEKDEGKEPLRLLMTYVPSPDVEGHAKGPDSAEVRAALTRLDPLVERFFHRATDIWKSKHEPGGSQLYVMVSSDHGMFSVSHYVHPEKLIGIAPDAATQIITTGNIGHVFADSGAGEASRKHEIDQIAMRLDQFPFVRAWKRAEIPAKWGLRHPSRTGDLLVVLAPGHTFNRRAKDLVVDVGSAPGPLGMHGYDPAQVPEMLTPMFVWRYPDPVKPRDLGPVESIQLHATVAKLLGIHPAPGADPQAVDLLP